MILILLIDEATPRLNSIQTLATKSCLSHIYPQDDMIRVTIRKMSKTVKIMHQKTEMLICRICFLIYTSILDQIADSYFDLYSTNMPG